MNNPINVTQSTDTDDRSLPFQMSSMDPEDYLDLDIELDDNTVVPTETKEPVQPEPLEQDDSQVWRDSPDDVDGPFTGHPDADDTQGGFSDPQQERSEDDQPKQPDPDDALDNDPNNEFFRAQRREEFAMREEIDGVIKALESQMGSEIARYDAERGHAEAVRNQLDTEARAIQADLERAAEDEDTGAAMQAQQRLNEINAYRQQAEAAAANIPTSEQIQEYFKTTAQERQNDIIKKRGPQIPRAERPTAREWQARNMWMANPKFNHVNKDVMVVNNQLMREGWDPDADSFYSELGRRLKGMHPDVPLKNKDGSDFGTAPKQAQQRRSPSRPPVGSARRTSQPSAEYRKSGNGKITVRLTAADKATMRGMGLDPTDKQLQVKWAEEKLKRLKGEQAMSRARR